MPPNHDAGMFSYPAPYVPAGGSGTIMLRMCGIAKAKNLREYYVIFTHPVLADATKNPQNKMKNVEATDHSFDDGNWIQCPITREAWCRMMNPNRWVEEPESEDTDDEDVFCCKCVKHFDLEFCAMMQFPIESIDKVALMISCEARCTSGYRFSSYKTWEDLPNNSKRWTLYWWYSVNIFQMRQLCGPLPHCVEVAIKAEYPNDHGVKYIGFKSTEERMRLTNPKKRTRLLVSGVGLGSEPTVPGSLKEDDDEEDAED